MQLLFVTSYATLWILALLEALVLYDLVRRTAHVRRVYSARRHGHHPTRLAMGTLAPVFSAPVIGSDANLTAERLRGHVAMLLFVSPTQHAPSTMSDSDLSFFAHVLWHRAEGEFYVMCSGHRDPCCDLSARLNQLVKHQIAVAWDEDGKIADAFRISTFPEAVQLDPDVCVARYGGMLVGHERVDAASTSGFGGTHGP